MLGDEIKKFFKGEVLTDDATLNQYSEDASIFKIKPEVVVSPRNVEDLQNLVKFVAKTKKTDKKISLSPRAAGTDMTGGSLTDSIVVSFAEHFNKIKEVRADGPDSGYGVVEPGVYYRDFEKRALEKDLIYPPYPASKEICAIGGIVSNNSAGEKSLSYGEAKDYVLELKVVLSDGSEAVFKPIGEFELKAKMSENNLEGKIYKKIWEVVEKNKKLIWESRPRVSKNSSGYFLWEIYDGKYLDLTKLIVGSQGTLAIITEAKLRLVRVKPHSRMVVTFLKDINRLGDLVNLILKSKPESLESYDDKTLMLATKFLPSLLKSLLKKKQNIFKLLFSFLPDLWVLLTFGFPKLVLIAEFRGNLESKVISDAKFLKHELKKRGFRTHLTSSQGEGEKYWTIRRESFNLLRQRVKNRHTAPFIDDVIVRHEDLPKFLPRLNALVSKYKELEYTIAGHAGDGNFHIIPLADFKNPNLKKIIEELSKEVYDLVREFGGSITAEHNDGLIRTPYLHEIYSPKIIKLFEQVKKVFDPQNIFNPGKKVNGDLKYALSKFKKN